MPVRRPRRDEEDDFEEDDDFEEFDVHDIVDEVASHPRVARVLDLITHTFDRFGQLIDQVSHGVPHGGAPPSNGQRRPTPNHKAINPWLVLGFQPGQKLTAEMIKARRKKLAKVYHDDVGDGDPEAMRMVNAAADMLLKKIGG
jgi:hypothetical protein